MERTSARWVPYKWSAPQPIIFPASSSTTKSRTFSQISARLRGSSVPSGEYAEINSWMRSASGNKASRVCMGLLVDGINPLPGGGDGLANPHGSGAAENIVNGKNVFEFHEIVESGIEMRVDGLQLFQAKFLKLTILVEREAHRLSNLFMRDAKRNSFAHQVRGRGKCVHIARFRRLLHALETKFHALHPSRDQGKYCHRIFGRVKERLLCFLEILVIGERQTFDRNQQRGCVANHSAGFAANEFEQVSIHLLWHRAAAGRVSFRQIDEAILLRGEQQHLLGPTTQVQGQERERTGEFENEIAIAGCVDRICGRSKEAQLRGHKSAIERQS